MHAAVDNANGKAFRLPSPVSMEEKITFWVKNDFCQICPYLCAASELARLRALAPDRCLRATVER